jgi:hypothetical protein
VFEDLENSRNFVENWITNNAGSDRFTVAPLYNRMVCLRGLNETYSVTVPESEGNIFYKRDFSKLCELDLDEKLTFKEIGTILDISESRASQLHQKSLQKLRTIMKDFVI